MSRYYNEDSIKKDADGQPDYLGKKDKQYFLQWARYIFRDYLYNRCTVRSGGFSTSGKAFSLLRAYALGNQNPSIYQDILDPCEEGAQDQGFMNINWDIVKILPKFRDLVRGKMMDIDYELQTQAIDETATKERTTKVNKLKLIADPRMAAALQQNGGVDIKLPQGIESPEDVEVLEKLGGLRLEREILIKDLFEASKYESKFDTIKDQLIDDIIDLNVCATRTYLEKKTGKVKIDRINPIDLICRASKYPDHRDIDFAGEVKRKTIAQLRAETNLSEEELCQLANNYRAYASNKGMDKVFTPYYNNELYGVNRQAFGLNAPYNDVTIEVMDFYFIASETEDYMVNAMSSEEQSKFQDAIAKDIAEEDTEGESEEEERAEDEKRMNAKKGVYQCVYHAQWVIGTSHIFDYGKEYGIVYQKADGVKRAILPIRIYADRTPSIVERCMSWVDDIQLAVLKKRNALQSLPPGPRMLINKSRLRASVDIGGKQYNMLTLLNIFAKTGRLVYESENEYEDENGGSAAPPISFAPSGIMEDIQIFLQDIESSIAQIRNVTGINEVADGTTQQQDMLQSVMQGLNNATNSTLRPHFRVYENHHLLLAEYTVLKWQIAVLKGDISAIYAPFGDNSLKTVVATKDLYDYDFGIRLSIKANSQERQMLMQDISAAKQQGQISLPNYILLWNMIMTGDLKKAQLYYAKAVEHEKAVQHQAQLEQLKAQGEANGNAAKIAEDAKTQNQILLLEAQTKLEQVKGEEARKTEMVKHENKMKELQVQAGHNIIQTTVDNAMSNLANTQQQGNTPTVPTT